MSIIYAVDNVQFALNAGNHALTTRATYVAVTGRRTILKHIYLGVQNGPAPGAGLIVFSRALLPATTSELAKALHSNAFGVSAMLVTDVDISALTLRLDTVNQTAVTFEFSGFVHIWRYL